MYVISECLPPIAEKNWGLIYQDKMGKHAACGRISGLGVLRIICV